MSQPSLLEISNLLSQILSSKEFRDSLKSQELLKYLVDKSSKVTSLKETEIACDVFGKDANFDPSIDSLIRSYISNVRKKLEHYYLTTEDKFEYKLEIPRGHYLIKYVKVNENVVTPPKRRINLSLIYLPIIAILFILLLFSVFNRSSVTVFTKPEIAINPIWDEFIEKNSFPTLFIIGDYLVMSQKGSITSRTFLRDPKVNSENDLRFYSNQFPDKYGSYEISDVSYVGTATTLGLPYLFHALGSASNKVSLRLSSQIKWQDLDNYNIVFVGSFKSLYKLDTLFSRYNIKYKLSPNELYINNGKNDSSSTIKLDWVGGNYQKDYSVICKTIGNKNNSFLFLAGFSEVGIMNAIRTATDPDLVSKINSVYPKMVMQKPFQFEMISEADGVQNTVLNSQIKYFNSIKNKP